MKGGRNLPTKSVFTTHRVPRRYVEPASPTRSADEALLNFVLGRADGADGATGEPDARVTGSSGGEEGS